MVAGSSAGIRSSSDNRLGAKFCLILAGRLILRLLNNFASVTEVVLRRLRWYT
jgi:hypothetical protein